MKEYKIIYLVGNGFDINVLSSLNQSPNTSYNHFYNFIKFAHPECDNILIKEMDNRKKSGEENWADFEFIVGELAHSSVSFKLRAALKEFQNYFSEFLNTIVTPSFLRYLDTYATQNDFFKSSISQFLGDLNYDITKCYLAKEFTHHNILDIKFLNFNYTNLLDNLVYLDKENFEPLKWNSGNNFEFHVNPLLIKGVHIENPNKFCKVKSEVLHPHGRQEVPRSILFGEGRNEKSEFSKPYWGRYDEKYGALFSNAALYVVYGMSISETDSWWWHNILWNIQFAKGKSQLVIYNFLGKKDDYEQNHGYAYNPQKETERVLKKLVTSSVYFDYFKKPGTIYSTGNWDELSDDYKHILLNNIFVVNYFSDEIQPRLFNMKQLIND